MSVTLQTWQTIWDDINTEVEALPVSLVKYDPGSLTNKLYDIIDDKAKLRQTLLENKVVGLYKDVSIIQEHRDIIGADKQLAALVKEVFNFNSELTSLDKVFVNMYYRRLLRARLEQDYCVKEISTNASIVGLKDIDKLLISALRLLRVVCKYLGIASTTTGSSFHKSKLDNTAFWASVSEKLLQLFGENRIRLIEEPEEDILGINGKNRLEQIREEDNIRSEIFVLLNVVFNGWSGSILTVKDDIITLVPATYVTRMITKLL